MNTQQTEILPLYPSDDLILPDEIKQICLNGAANNQLINDCLESKKSFGIPYSNADHMHHFGTVVTVEDITGIDPSGKLIIAVKGGSPFKMMKLCQEANEKPYPVGKLAYMEMVDEPAGAQLLSWYARYLKEFPVSEGPVESFARLKTFDIARHVLLSKLEKYKLIALTHDTVRQDYLIKTIRLLLILKKQENQAERGIYLS